MSAYVDFATQYEFKHSVGPRTKIGNGTLVGTGVDCAAYEQAIQGLLGHSVPTGSPTSMSLTPDWKESDDDSTYAAPNQAKTETVLSDVSNSETTVLRLVREKRYVRLDVTIAFTGGSSPTVDLFALVVGKKKITGAAV